MNRLLACFLLCLSASASLAAADAPDAPRLTRMLNQFLEGASLNDITSHERFWADDLIYTSSRGRRFTRDEILHMMKTASESEDSRPITRYLADHIKIQQYGDTAVVAFRLKGTTPGRDQEEPDVVKNYYNTGTFLRRDGQWRVVAWQATNIPEE